MVDVLEVAALQYPIRGGLQLGELLARIERYAGEARDAGAKLVVFPELVVLDLLESAAPVIGQDADATPDGFHGQAACLTPQDSGFAGVLAEGPRNREAIVHAQLDLAQLRRTRKTAGLYAARDQAARPIPRVVTD